MCLLITILFSCDLEEFQPLNEDVHSTNNTEEVVDVVVENGRLSFDNQEAVDVYLKKVSDILENNKGNVLNKSAKTSNFLDIPGFNSLAGKLEKSENNSLFKKTSSDEDQEDDFFAELSNQLMPDKVIHYLVDTTNTVKIREKLYQISPFGTFVYSESDSLEYNELQDSFIDGYSEYSSRIDSITYTYNNITFIDSYGKISNLNPGESLEDSILKELTGGVDDFNEESLSLKSSLASKSDDRILSSYTSTYGLTTYKAGAKTLVGGWIQSAFGQNSWREKRLDSRHRLKVKLYNVNYGFYDNQGFKVEYNELRDVTIKIYYFHRWRLRSKRVKLWSYWSSSKRVSEMVVGIDYFKGYTQFDSYGIGTTYDRDLPREFSKHIGNLLSISLFYDGVLKNSSEKVKGWATDNLHLFKGVVNFADKEYTDNDLINKGVNSGIDAFKSILRSETSGFIYNKLGGNPKNKTVALTTPDYFNGGNKEYLLLSGINKYSNKSKVDVQFGFPSYGFSYSYNGKNKFSGYTPNKFTVEEAYVFGAVKHNGRWQGIRMYID
jgi:hypothetical protein